MNDTTLRESPLGAETTNPELERRYREKLEQLHVRKLTNTDRAGLTIALLGAVGVAVWFVGLLGSPKAATHPVGVVALWVGLALCTGWVAHVVALLRRGHEDFRHERQRLADMVLLSSGTMVMLVAWDALHQGDPARGALKMGLAILAWAVSGLPFYLSQVVREQALKLRVDVLRVELALAERERRGE